MDLPAIGPTALNPSMPKDRREMIGAKIKVAAAAPRPTTRGSISKCARPLAKPTLLSVDWTGQLTF